jgi:hypothetical protein
MRPPLSIDPRRQAMKRNVSYMLVIGLAFGVEICLRVGKIVYPPVLRVTDPTTISQ